MTRILAPEYNGTMPGQPKAANHFDLDGELTDRGVREQLGDLVVKLVEHAQSPLTTA
jgi:hypothetical protein